MQTPAGSRFFSKFKLMVIHHHNKRRRFNQINFYSDF